MSAPFGGSHASVAQRLEQVAFNHKVVGSNPTGGTMKVGDKVRWCRPPWLAGEIVHSLDEERVEVRWDYMDGANAPYDSTERLENLIQWTPMIKITTRPIRLAA